MSKPRSRRSTGGIDLHLTQHATALENGKWDKPRFAHLAGASPSRGLAEGGAIGGTRATRH